MIQAADVLPGFVVAVVWGILASDLDRKGHVSDVQELDFIGMPRHHRRSSQHVSHARSHVVDPIASCRIASHKYFVSVDHFQHCKGLDDFHEEVLQVFFMPHIGSLFARSGDEPDRAGRQVLVVEMQVVFELTVVDIACTVSPSMKPQYQTIAIDWSLPMNEKLKAHVLVFYLQCLAFQHRSLPPVHLSLMGRPELPRK